jgi:hypothetical protein
MASTDRGLFMRLAAFSGLLICSLVITREAAGDDADRFVEAAKTLIKAINSADAAGIQANFDTGMQQLLPPDKAAPFFRGIVSGKGKLKEAGVPEVTGPTAIVRVTAERGAWDFKISLDPAGKIAGLLVTPAAAKALPPATTPAATPAQRFTKATNKLIQAINNNDSAAIQANFDATMQQALPADKATPFFSGLVSAFGKLKQAGAPQVTGSTAIVRVTAERGAWDFKFMLDGSDKISSLEVTPSGSGPIADSTSGSPGNLAGNSPAREWSDVTGKFRVKAELMGVKDGNVQLKLSDGKVISVPVAKLSTQDQDALKKLPPSAAAK